MLDASQECTAYYYAPSATAVQAGKFPTIWQNATILPNDSDAQALWAKIEPSVPTNIQPKGTRSSSTQGVTYDTATDPDCCEYLVRYQAVGAPAQRIRERSGHLTPLA